MAEPWFHACRSTVCSTRPPTWTNVLSLLPQIAAHTQRLEDMSKSVERVADDTGSPTSLEQNMATVADTTSTLRPMDQRMANIEQAMPTLLEVQQDLARVPDTLKKLNANMERLTGLLDRPMTSLEGLNRGVDSLQQAVGRWAAWSTGYPAGSRVGTGPTPGKVDAR